MVNIILFHYRFSLSLPLTIYFTLRGASASFAACVCFNDIFFCTVNPGRSCAHVGRAFRLACNRKRVKTGCGPRGRRHTAFCRSVRYAREIPRERAAKCRVGERVNAQKEGWLASWKAGLGTCPAPRVYQLRGRPHGGA